MQRNPPGRGATGAHRLREPGVGSSNLSVQTHCEVVEAEPRLTLNQEDQVRALASQPDDASAVVAHLDSSTSACCAGGGSFLTPEVAGSSPVALWGVAQWQSTEKKSSAARVLRPTPPPVSCEGRAFFLWREGPHGLPFESAPLVHSGSLTGTSRHPSDTRYATMAKFSGTNRHAAAHQRRRADPHAAHAHAHARGRRRLRARRRVGSVPARGHEHGRRGHVLRARRRRATRASSTSSARSRRPTRRSSPAPTSTRARSVSRSTCARRC